MVSDKQIPKTTTFPKPVNKASTTINDVRDIQNANPAVGALIALQTMRVQKAKAKYTDLKNRSSNHEAEIHKTEMAHGAYLEARTSLKQMIALAKTLTLTSKAKT